jgi:hypothetical protein
MKTLSSNTVEWQLMSKVFDVLVNENDFMYLTHEVEVSFGGLT